MFQSSRIYIYFHICIYIYIFKIRWSTERFVFFEFIYFVLTYVLYTCITYVLYICMFPACCFHQRTCVAQGLLNGVPNETWIHSRFQYKWFLSDWICFIRVFVPPSWSMFTLVFSTLLCYLISLSLCVCVCVCVCVSMCVCWF